MTADRLRAEALDLGKRALALALLLWVLFGLVFGLAAMPNDDMKPSLRAGDLLLFYRLERTWDAQQVVLVRQDGGTWAGRVAARPGDTVEVTEDGRLLVNGSLVVENDILTATPRYEEGGVTYPLTLGEAEYFVLCDLREGGRDSRFYGAVPKSDIQGRVITALRRSTL